VARSPFITVSSRLPGATYDAISAAYAGYALVRGSNLRGTVHTSVREHHPLLDAVTRRVMDNGWRRNLGLEQSTPADVQAGIEAFATGVWRTPDELRANLVAWLGDHDGHRSAERARTTGVGRAFAHIHSALIRRPLDATGWERQTAPVYRVAADVLGEPRSDLVDDPDRALMALTRQHLAAYGPANRRDIAWWTGEKLGNVDRALTTLAEELTERPGPDGQTYHDLLDAPGNGWLPRIAGKLRSPRACRHDVSRNSRGPPTAVSRSRRRGAWRRTPLPRPRRTWSAARRSRATRRPSYAGRRARGSAGRTG
jgi:hypothetical protein